MRCQPIIERGARASNVSLPLAAYGFDVSTAPRRDIALFFTGRQHAGKNLADVLKRRAAELSAPIQMCDALSRNLPKLPRELEIIVGHCLAHSRRRFVEVAPNFPEECRFVLESFREVYVNDTLAREQNVTPEQRLAFHRTHSGPVMPAFDLRPRSAFSNRDPAHCSALRARFWSRCMCLR